MFKAKKRKLNHADPGTGLTQDEIWDDSALIRSWEDAYAEYQFYHSVHARGEDIEEVLRRAEAEAEAVTTDHRALENGKVEGSTTKVNGQPEDKAMTKGAESFDGKLDESRDQAIKMIAVDDEFADGIARNLNEDDEIEEGELDEAEVTTTTMNEVAVEQIGSLSTKDKKRTGVDPAVACQQNDAGGASQTLENIKMAYYWAGYYSGLYDGQRQAQNQG